MDPLWIRLKVFDRLVEELERRRSLRQRLLLWCQLARVATDEESWVAFAYSPEFPTVTFLALLKVVAVEGSWERAQEELRRRYLSLGSRT